MSDAKQEGISVKSLLGHSRPFLKYTFRRWSLLIVAAIAGIALGLLYYYIQKPKYKAECTFILEEKQSGMGGLSGIASQFGFDLGGLSGGNGIFTGDNILEILRSKKILRQVLLSRVDSTKANGPTLADLYIDFSQLRTKWKPDTALKSVSFRDNISALSLKQDTALNIIYDRLIRKSLIVDRVNKNGNLIYVQVIATNRQFAILMSQRIVEEAKLLYIDIRVGNALSSISRLQAKADSLEALLNRRTYSAASSQVIDANPGINATRVPVEIATREKTVAATLYAEIVKNLEASRMMLAQQTPVIQIIDYPDMTAKDNLTGQGVAIAIAIAAMLLLAGFIILIRYIIDINIKF